MRRELVLLEEMIDAAEQAHLLAADQAPESLASDRQRRDALLWNFTVLGEAAAQLPDEIKASYPEILDNSPPGCATEPCTATGRSTWTF
ncbi:MAG: DUF86 domain-containing protein [Actinomycetes bacterium]